MILDGKTFNILLLNREHWLIYEEMKIYNNHV